MRRLVLVAGWTGPDDEYPRSLMTAWRRTGDDAETFGRFGTLTAFSRAFQNMIGSAEVDKIVASNQPTPGVLRQIELNLRVDVRDLLPKIIAPTLVIGCTLDQMVPGQNARDLHAAIAGSTYAGIESGHVVLFEQPGEFVKLVADFIE